MLYINLKYSLYEITVDKQRFLVPIYQFPTTFIGFCAVKIRFRKCLWVAAMLNHCTGGHFESQAAMFNHWRACWTTGGHVEPLAAILNHWRPCWTTGGNVEPLAAMLNNWRPCWTTGVHVEPLAAMLNHWQPCWITFCHVGLLLEGWFECPVYLLVLPRLRGLQHVAQVLQTLLHHFRAQQCVLQYAAYIPPKRVNDDIRNHVYVYVPIFPIDPSSCKTPLDEN